MESLVQVRLHPKGRLVSAWLTTERGGLPVVVVEGQTKPRGPGEVETVYIMADTPVELLDAAVDSGFYVLGQPRRVKR